MSILKVENNVRLYENDRKWKYDQVGGINNHFQLFPYQIKAIEWMRQIEKTDPRDEEWLANDRGLRGGILSLSMGLGKTICAVAHSLFSPRISFYGLLPYPDLIVCSKSVMTEWKDQFSQMFGKRVAVLFYHKDYIGKSKFDNITRNDICKYRFLVTTYQVLTGLLKYEKDRSTVERDNAGRKTNIIIEIKENIKEDNNLKGPRLLYNIKWGRMITDESHVFVNPNTQRFAAVMSVCATYRWCLTGTPYWNSNEDICSLYRFMGYEDRYFKGNSMGYLDWCSIVKQQKYDRYIFKMGMAEAGIEIPPLFDKTVYIEPEENQSIVYDLFRDKARQTYYSFSHGEKNYASIFAEIMRLRQLCVAPYMILPHAKRDKMDTFSTRKIIREILDDTYLLKWLYDIGGTSGIKSSKILYTLKIIKKLAPSSKVIIFSSFTSCLDLVEKAIKKYIPHAKYVMMDGSTSGPDRVKVLHSFRNNPSTKILLATYKTGSEGLNLTHANTVILMDAWWTFAVESQAISRVYRMGQRKHVTVYRLIMREGIEKTCVQLKAREKKRQSENFLEGATKKFDFIQTPIPTTKRLSKEVMKRLLHA